MEIMILCRRYSDRCKRYAAFLLAAFFSPIAIASTTQAVERFTLSLSTAPAVALIDLTELQQLDEALIRPASLYPAFNSVSLPALSALYRFRRQCSDVLDGVPAPTRQFEQALCNKTSLPEAWFAANPIHPLGGSYAWHYLARHPESSVALQRFLHVRERPDALAGLGRLSDDNLDAIVSGQHWLLQDGMLWWEHQQVWSRYAPQVWRPLARQAGLEIKISGQRCDLPLGNICANPIPTFDGWWRWLLAFTALIVVLALADVLWQRRRLQSRQQFILQMLTHELRTPIVNLGNVVESFRHDFDALPESAQTSFGRLADGVQRMRQLADASRHYLSADGDHGALEPSTAVVLSEWLASVSERHEGLQFCLEQDRQLSLPLYWVSLCLDNVLNNARRYGKAPIRLNARWRKGWLTLTVTDAGVLTQYKLAHMRRSSLSGSGMGFGLAIVRRVMKRLKGKIRLSGPPTTFTLELPCELQH